MRISFNHIIPHPIKEIGFQKESVWGAEFTINTSDIILLNAVSGKGKSTFVNILSGNRKDFDGTITYDDKNINQMTLDEWAEIRSEKISVVYQDLQLFSQLTVWENLMLKNSLTNHLSENELSEMLTKLKIDNLKNQICKTLSYGQQQRVAIIRALAQPFKILLMDEPFSHLDKENESIALEMVQAELEKNKAGMIITSLGSAHNLKFDKELKL